MHRILKHNIMENTEFKGTKGKWELKNNQYGYYTSVFTNNSQNTDPFRTICVSRVNDQEQNNANLKLISKAPEMLEMLRSIVIRFEDNERLSMMEISILNDAKQLIKEATNI